MINLFIVLIRHLLYTVVGAFIDRDTLLFEYSTDIIMTENGGISSKKEI